MTQNETIKSMLSVALSMGKLTRLSMIKRGASFAEIRSLDEHISICEKDLDEANKKQGQA